MGKYRSKRLPIFLCITLLFSTIAMTGCRETKETDTKLLTELPLEIEFSYYGGSWNASLFAEHSLFTSQETFERIVTEEIIGICNLLGYQDFWTHVNPDAEKLELYFEFSSVSRSQTNWLSRFGEKGVTTSIFLLNEQYAGYKDGALAHELTHVLAGPSFSRSLEEGLCEYVAEYVGYSSKIDFMKQNNINLSVQELIKLNHELISQKLLEHNTTTQEQLDTIWDNVGASGGYTVGSGSTWQTSRWYSLSESFTTYLIEQYGMEKVTSLIRNGIDESSYQEYLGKSFAEVKSDWKDYYDTLELSYTLEEYEQFIIE